MCCQNFYVIFVKKKLKRYIALDIGRKKTGIAVTDTNRIIASPFTTIATNEIETFLKSYFLENQVEKVIVGLPKQMDNTASQSMKYVEPIFNRLKKVFKEIEFIYIDERFTSKLAFQTMIAAGIKKQQRQDKTIVDKISAAIILDSYLEKEKWELRIKN